MKSKWLIVFALVLAVLAFGMVGCRHVTTQEEEGEVWVLYEDGEWAEDVNGSFEEDDGNLLITFDPALDISGFSKVVIIVSAVGYIDWWCGGTAHDIDENADIDWNDTIIVDEAGCRLEIPIATIDTLADMSISGGGNDGGMEEGADAISKIYLVE
jgi:hypothetical protein